MTQKNRYEKFAKISGAKFRVLLKLFCVDLDASQIFKITGLNRNTVNRYIRAIRVEIAKICEKESPFSGEVEVDESYFGPRGVKGKRGRGSSQKTIVFGIFKRNGSAYTEIVPDCSRPTLQAVIRGKVSL
ncbi:MAG TPA: transposase, partial [Thermodesulfobacteriota bacterium]|nr:transposase [Thermodesulfobacteriota bacterium]